jgi:hypothetical protein
VNFHTSANTASSTTTITKAATAGLTL